MKITVVTNSRGKLIASVIDQGARRQSSKIAAGLRPGPGQHCSELEIPDEYLKGTSDDLHAALENHDAFKALTWPARRR